MAVSFLRILHGFWHRHCGRSACRGHLWKSIFPPRGGRLADRCRRCRVCGVWEGVVGSCWAEHRFFFLRGPGRIGFSDLTVSFHRRLLLHQVGDLGVNVQRGRRGKMSDDVGQSLHIHAVFQSHGGEGVPKLVEAENRVLLVVAESRICYNADRLWFLP